MHLLFLSAVSLLLSPVFTIASPRAILPGSSSRSFPWIPSKTHALVTQINDSVFGLANISYFVVGDQVIVDGDVIYGSVEKLLAAVVKPKGTHTPGLRLLPKRAHSITRMLSPTKPWPNAKISYKYASAATEARLKPTVDEAMLRWRRKAPYLQFLRQPSSEKDVDGVVTFWDAPCTGCNSHLGFTTSPGEGGMRVNLQSGCEGTWDTCTPDIAVHEIGHLLGLHHEHQRADRNSFIQFKCEALDPQCPAGSSLASGQTCCDMADQKLASSIPPGCCSMVYNFDIQTGLAYDASGSYDTNSIMHYEPGAFALPGQATLVATSGSGAALRSHLPGEPSDGDVERICQLYPGACEHWKLCKAHGCPTDCRSSGCNSPLCGFRGVAPSCCQGTPCTPNPDTCSRLSCNDMRV